MRPVRVNTSLGVSGRSIDVNIQSSERHSSFITRNRPRFPELDVAVAVGELHLNRRLPASEARPDRRLGDLLLPRVHLRLPLTRRSFASPPPSLPFLRGGGGGSRAGVPPRGAAPPLSRLDLRVGDVGDTGSAAGAAAGSGSAAGSSSSRFFFFLFFGSSSLLLLSSRLLGHFLVFPVVFLVLPINLPSLRGWLLVGTSLVAPRGPVAPRDLPPRASADAAVPSPAIVAAAPTPPPPP